AHSHTTGSAGSAHTHTIGSSAGSGTSNVQTLNGSNVSINNHVHPSFSSSSSGGAHTHTTGNQASVTTSTAQNLPAFREVIFCKAERDATSYPATAILLSEEMCSGEWSEIVSFRNRLVRGHDRDENLQEVGGSDSHTHSWSHSHGGVTNAAGAHTHTGAMSSATGALSAAPGGTAVAAHGHTHTYI